MMLLLFTVLAAWLGGFLMGAVAFGLAGMYYRLLHQKLPQPHYDVIEE